MYLTLIILPLLASIVSGLLGRVVGSRGAQIITSSFIFLTTMLAINIFLEVGFNNTAVTLELFRWIDSESLNVYWGFNFDALTVSMLIPVLIISTLVHIYSIGYMANDPHIQRFFSYLSLFTFMMVILVTANNLLLMFVGWEGVGVCSYLLVSFWYTRIAANQSSLAAFLTNRVGDCFLTIGMFIILWTMGNIDYATIFSLSPYINENIITIIGICLLIGAMAKSSQIGLHVWLPMAMEGPTPVSALIHAATMVTAGVYLLIRSSPLLEYSSTALLLCLWIGAITTVFSSLIGLFQQDIKKVIAYSTMSQLGMMVIAVGLSSYNLALFHLVNHAFYKGLLFLAAGSVIHAVADNQDFRKYGGLKAFLPLTYSVMLIASLSLIAFPFMTGFYSKDFILESAFGQFYFSSYVVYYIASIGAIFTTLYSVKVLYLTFLTNPNGSLSDYRMAHEGDIFMSLPLIILAVFSIFFGYITKDIFIGIATGFFIDNSVFIHPNHEILIETEFAVPVFYKLLPFFNTVLFTILALISSEYYPSSLITFKFSRWGYNIFGFFNQRFLIEMFYNKYITNIILLLGGQTTKILDKGSVEYLGPHGLAISLTNMSNFIKKLDSGIITNYALYILSGLVFYLFVQYSNIMEDVLLMTLLYGLLLLLFINDYKFIDKYLSPVISQALPKKNSLTIKKSEAVLFAVFTFFFYITLVIYIIGSLFNYFILKYIASGYYFAIENICSVYSNTENICSVYSNTKQFLIENICSVYSNTEHFFNTTCLHTFFFNMFCILNIIMALCVFYIRHVEYIKNICSTIGRFIWLLIKTIPLPYLIIYIWYFYTFCLLIIFFLLCSFNLICWASCNLVTEIIMPAYENIFSLQFESVTYLSNGEVEFHYSSNGQKVNLSFFENISSLSFFDNDLAYDNVSAGGLNDASSSDPSAGSSPGDSALGSSHGDSSDNNGEIIESYPCDMHQQLECLFTEEARIAIRGIVQFQAQNLVSDFNPTGEEWAAAHDVIMDRLFAAKQEIGWPDSGLTPEPEGCYTDTRSVYLEWRHYVIKALVSAKVYVLLGQGVQDSNGILALDLPYFHALVHSDTTLASIDYDSGIQDIHNDRNSKDLYIKSLDLRIFADNMENIRSTYYNNLINRSPILSAIQINEPLNIDFPQSSQQRNSSILQEVRNLEAARSEASISQSGEINEGNTSENSLKRKRDDNDVGEGNSDNVEGNSKKKRS